MRLVYTNGVEVSPGDQVTLDGDLYKVTFFRPPTSPASSGKVTVMPINKKSSFQSREYFVSVIGAEWIEREDRD